MLSPTSILIKIIAVVSFISWPLTKSLQFTPPLFVVPEKLHRPFRPISAEDLKCPKLHHQPPGLPTPTHTFYFYKFTNPPARANINGYLCLGVKYEVECSEGFFGTRSIIKTISKTPVNKKECTQQVLEYIRGHYLDPYFPGEECYWMQTYTAEKSFITVTSHSVIFDMYKNELEDPLFGEKGCTSSGCETVHENAYWFTPGNYSSGCGNLSLITGEFYPGTKTSPPYLRSDLYHFHNLSASCRIDFCGYKGIKLDDGQFLVDPQKAIKALPICDRTARVGFIPEEKRQGEITLELEQLEDRMECLEAIQEIKQSGQITFAHLSKFQPKYATTWHIYRLNQNRLEGSIATWVELATFGPLHGNVVGELINKTKYSWSEWMELKNSTDKSGFNGVHRTDSGDIIVPDQDKYLRENAESTVMKRDVVFVNHPILNLADKEGLDDTLVRLTNKNVADIGEWITSVWNSTWGKICIILWVILGIVILCIVIRLIKVCIIRRNLSERKDKNCHLYELKGRMNSYTKSKSAAVKETSFSF